MLEEIYTHLRLLIKKCFNIFCKFYNNKYTKRFRVFVIIIINIIEPGFI